MRATVPLASSTEQPLLFLRPSRRVAIPYYFFALLFFGGAVYTFFKLPDVELLGVNLTNILRAISVGFLGLFGLILLLVAEIRRLGKAYIVTTERVSRRDGIVRQFLNSMPFNKIERVAVERGILDRMLGLGDVVIDTGEDMMFFQWIRHPFETESLIQRELQRVRGGRASVAPIRSANT